MIVVGIDSLPIFIPVEHQDAIIIAATQDVWHSWMNYQVPNEVCVLSTNRFKLLTCVVIVNTDFRVI